MGSGRGDRNQDPTPNGVGLEVWTLQWGPVVVTGISYRAMLDGLSAADLLQWGPVVVTGIRQPPISSA